MLTFRLSDRDPDLQNLFVRYVQAFRPHFLYIFATISLHIDDESSTGSIDRGDQRTAMTYASRRGEGSHLRRT